MSVWFRIDNMKLRLLFLAVAILCLSLLELFAQKSTETSSGQLEQLRGQVASFSDVLLSRERYQESISFVSESAFHNPGLISASCVGILPSPSNATPDARRKGVKKFLNAFHEELALGAPGEAALTLSTDGFERGAVDLEGITVANDWRRDKFILGSLSRDSIRSAIYPDDREKEEREFLFKALEASPPLYFNLVVVKSGDSEIPIILVWKKEAGVWKIIHIDFICA